MRCCHCGQGRLAICRDQHPHGQWMYDSLPFYTAVGAHAIRFGGSICGKSPFECVYDVHGDYA